jgi:hypothetical protein
LESSKNLRLKAISLEWILSIMNRKARIDLNFIKNTTMRKTNFLKNEKPISTHFLHFLGV